MTRILRIALLILLLPALAVTGLGGAWARGQAPAVGTVELCLGLTAVSLAVDAEGAPTAPPHLCGERALLLILALAEASPEARSAALALWSPPAPAAPLVQARRAAMARARGPPAGR
jgi:hypothetical protein